MTFSGDPYRTLGLPPGASLDDVKRAYRRLAKLYHPDAAGPEAIVRFLAIQGAYEALAAPGRRGRMPGRGAGRPSQADPDRARATREAYRPGRGGGWGGAGGSGPGGANDPWRGGTGPGPSRAQTRDSGVNAEDRPGSGTTGSRGRGASPSGPGSPGTAGRSASGGMRSSAGSRGSWSGATSRDASSGGRGPGDSGQSGASSGTGGGRRADRAGGRGPGEGPSAGTAPPRGPASGGRGGDRKPSRRKATLNSTSYDDAAREPRHPEWQGSSWYGTSSGTYWTINPREYADPRKHGPEYQARARRAASSADPAPADEPAAGTTPMSSSFAASAARNAWSDAGHHGPPEPSPTDHGNRLESAAEPDEAPSDVPTAGAVGLLAGAIAAVPASVIALGSMMSGDLSLAAVAIAVPAVVAASIGLSLIILRRTRS